MFEILDENFINENSKNSKNSKNIKNNKNISVFNIITIDKSYSSPYCFNKYLKKNISYNEFTQYCLRLLKYNIINQELEYLEKNYSYKKIKNNKQLIYYIHNIYINTYRDLIESYIINKRFEYLLEYLKKNEFSYIYINYVNEQLKSLYSSSKYLLNYV